MRANFVEIRRKVAKNREILKGMKLERIFRKFSKPLLFWHARNYGLVGEIELENSFAVFRNFGKSVEFSKRDSIFREKGIEFSANDSLKMTL